MSRDNSSNILYIFADQLQAFALGCMGNNTVKTPNLDRLAEEGVLFENCYSNAPVCTPYRGVLFTGKYSSQTGITGNEHALPSSESLADRLNECGYRTSYVGKWHLGGNGNVAVPPHLRGGFQEFIGYQCYNDFLRQVWFFDEDEVKHEYDRHRTDVTTDIAIERLNQLSDSRFAMFISYQNPHYPVQPAKAYADLYKDVSIQRRPNVEDIDPYTRTFSPPTGNQELDLNYLRYGDDLDEYMRLYYAMVTQLDDNIGRLLNHLDDLGLTEKTLIVFTSDHGDMQGSHGLKNKAVFWEESTRVPLIVKGPGCDSKSGSKKALISTVDFFPTLLDVAGGSAEKQCEGDSFLHLLHGEETQWRNEVFAEYGSWIMIRKEHYKLVMDTDSMTATHLFDLREDPYEQHNLVDTEKDKTVSLSAKLMRWRDEVLSRANQR